MDVPNLVAQKSECQIKILLRILRLIYRSYTETMFFDEKSNSLEEPDSHLSAPGLVRPNSLCPLW